MLKHEFQKKNYLLPGLNAVLDIWTPLYALILILSNKSSLFPDPAGMPAGASGRRRPTVLPNSRITPVPALASNHTPVPGTSVQTEHPAHWKTHKSRTY